MIKANSLIKVCSRRENCINPLRKDTFLLPISEFYKSASRPDGHRGECKKCTNRTHRNWCLNNKETYNNTQRAYYSKLTKKQKEIRRKRNATWMKSYVKYRIKTDMGFKLRIRLRSRLADTLRAKLLNKDFSAFSLLGTSIEDFMLYLSSKFEPGMTWENWGKYTWHIDHIKPLASFDLTNPQELKLAFHYTNLQPLWAKENLSKGSKIEWSKVAVA